MSPSRDLINRKIKILEHRSVSLRDFDVLQLKYKKISELNTNSICWLIGDAVQNYDRHRNDNEFIGAFYLIKFWKDRTYAPNPSNFLLHCMQHMTNAPSSSSQGYKSASDYTIAAQKLLDEGVRPDEMYEELKRRGGPYAVIREMKKDAAGVQDEADGRDEEEEEVKGNDKRVDTAAPRPTRDDVQTLASSKPGGQKQPSQPDLDQQREMRVGDRVRLFMKDKHLAIEDDGLRDELYAMALHASLWICIERLDDEGGYFRFKIVDVDPDPVA
ncbi:hypothetical protein MKK75_03700 [Methylobacterium sp. J-030]|uniref:hypothetical protein n=1 Tax=Methylobacterium sp. J-030 TaxID=2836627 RepID=UPI001FB8FB02|nr:hypothetical protein [Methylobacterium sp. J-030]MCJ2067922.1 hypothetical protein [Methylobacterium sp. J-030]